VFGYPICVQHLSLLKQTFESNVTNFESNYAKVVPNRIQVKYSKYVLGVHKSATNIAILGELGLYPLSLNAQVLSFEKISWLSHVSKTYHF
jgi:hypothetical protein